MDGVQEHGSQQTNKQMKVVENLPIINKNKGCVITLWPCHFTLKKDLKAKEELWKNSNISPCKNIPNLQKIL